MLVPIPRVEDVADPEPMDLLDAILPRMHFDHAIEHDENLGTVIDVPFVRLIGPMKADGDVIDPFDIDCFPRPGAGEGGWYDGAHSLLSNLIRRENRPMPRVDRLAKRRQTPAFRGLKAVDRDRTDKRILALLEKNARMTAAAIGREIGLSRTAVQDRISRMEADGTIQGYRVVAADNSAGLVRALIFVTIAERPCDKALRWLVSLEGVISVHSLAGELDAVATVIVPSVAELSSLNDRIGKSALIARAHSQVILRTL